MPLNRRRFLLASSASAGSLLFGTRTTRAAAALTSRERVTAAFAGKEVDRPPFSLWNHFGLEKAPPEEHAAATLAFHRDYATDLVKVMSDFPYPRPAGRWFEPKEEANPFPAQIRALERIKAGLADNAPFVETIFNPWNVAEKLSSPADVRRLSAEQPQKLLDALEVIARSEANHARRAIEAGAEGIFLAVANADESVLGNAEYARFSEPFDRLVLESAKGAPFNILHIHGAKVPLARFYEGWPAAINYSTAATGASIAAVRAQYPGVIVGGIDEVSYRTTDAAGLKAQYEKARAEAGARFVLTPGCSVPNDATPDELRRLGRIFAL